MREGGPQPLAFSGQGRCDMCGFMRSTGHLTGRDIFTLEKAPRFSWEFSHGFPGFLSKVLKKRAVSQSLEKNL